MIIKEIKGDEYNLKLLIKDSNSEFVNSLRRIIMTEVPILAVDEVSVYKNETIMFDEMIAQRIAMIPLKTDLKTYKNGDSIKLTLKEKGPKMVYSRDIKCVDPKIRTVDNNIPIVELGEEQELKLEMKAVMKSGKEHAKWQPALVYFKEVPELVTEKKTSISKVKQMIPNNLIDVRTEKHIFLKDPYKNDIESYIEDISDEGIKVKYNGKNFVFTVESYGGLTAKECIVQAAEVIEEKAKELSKEIENI